MKEGNTIILFHLSKAATAHSKEPHRKLMAEASCAVEIDWESKKVICIKDRYSVEKYVTNRNRKSMKAVLTVRMTNGMSVQETVDEAIRLSHLLGVMIQYEFNDIDICILGDKLVYAIDTDSNTSQWFLSHGKIERI